MEGGGGHTLKPEKYERKDLCKNGIKGAEKKIKKKYINEKVSDYIPFVKTGRSTFTLMT